MQSLNDLIGKPILLMLIDSNVHQHDITLHGVETGGIWIESEYLEDVMGFRSSKAESVLLPSFKPVFFIPFGRIKVLVASSTELDEGAFG